jgi:hypothetical protein
MIHESAVDRQSGRIERRLPSASIIARKSSVPESSGANALRQRVGNQGIHKLMAERAESGRASGVAPLRCLPIQTKLTVSEPGDAREREADHVADAVMRMPANQVADKPIVTSASPPPGVQRMCADCDEEQKHKASSQVQRKAQGTATPALSAPVAANIQALRGGGSALPAAARAFFEPRFGADFSNVRVHTGARAEEAAESISANAFTVGNDIAFRSGQYSPHSAEGQRLLAHELTHVVQQTGTVQRAFKSDDNHNLQSERFGGDDRLENIFDGKQEQFLRSGSTGDAVLKVQQTLIELGFPLPKFGADGKFGDETGSAVAKFKAQNGIAPSDPVVGSKTIAALDAALVKRVPVPTCVDGPVNTEAEPLPSIPLPSITKMKANDLLELVKTRQVLGGHVPKHPPLGATIPTIENLKPASVRTEPVSSENCLKCIADWDVPQPKVEIFLAVGDFSDEPKRSFPVQDQSVSGCPFETGGTFKDVMKRILPEAERIILDAELEHWSDFVLTHLIITGRYLSNVRRLTSARTHLRGKDAADCANKVNQFLFDTSTFPVPFAIATYGLLSGVAVKQVHSDTTTKREDDHSAVSVPPMHKKPVFPNIDNAINPFACSAFFRKFDRTMAPKIPGPPFSAIVEDKEQFIPRRQPWNTL